MRPLDLDELRVLVEDQESIIKFFEDKIKFLEDNAFSDRAKIGELENKLKCLSEEYHEFIAYNSGARD